MNHGGEAPDPESPPVKYPKRSQYKYAKSRYRVRNWRKYEAGLRRRGDLTVWFSEDVLDSWRAPPSGKPGGQRTYADIAIEAALTIRMVFQLPLRQTEGFLRSLAHMLEVEIRPFKLSGPISNDIAWTWNRCAPSRIHPMDHCENVGTRRTT